jgi:hypothetical protein
MSSEMKFDGPMSGDARGTVTVQCPLALASIDQLVDELHSRSKVCVMAMVTKDGALRTSTSGDPLARIGLCGLVATGESNEIYSPEGKQEDLKIPS